MARAVPKKIAGTAKGFTYRQQFGVIAICADEREQQRAYKKIAKLGFKVRVVCV